MKISAASQVWVKMLEFASNVVSNTGKDVAAFKALTIKTNPLATGDVKSLHLSGASRLGFLKFSTEGFTYDVGTNLDVNLELSNATAFVKNVGKGLNVVLEVEETSIKLYAENDGKVTAKISIAPLSDFDAIVEPPAIFSEPVDVSTVDLKKVVSLITLSELGFQYRGIFFLDNYIVGGSSEVLGVIRSETKFPEKSVDPGIEFLLAGRESLEVSFSEYSTKFSDADMSYRAQNLVMAPPKVHKLAELQTSAGITLDKNELLQSLKLAGALSGETDYCLFSAKPDELVIKNTAGSAGAGEYTCPATATTPFVFMVKASVLSSALRALEGDKVTIGDVDRYLLIREGNFTEVLIKASKEKMATYALHS